jgi:hypothetical protein
MLKYGREKWALNRSERRNIETAETRFIRRIHVHACADHVRSTTICNALQIYAPEERIHGYENTVASEEWTLQD